jgi:D-sedoheptulose 7-phosphate isomerase
VNKIKEFWTLSSILKTSSMDIIRKSLEQSAKVLDDFMNNEHNLRNIKSAADLMVNSLKSGGKIISFGNGGSMCDAMH